nr:reverse transcriptase domain-containing protein [Tanacetum cinerariifolium]
DVQPPVVQSESPILNSEPFISPIIEPIASPVSAPKPNLRPAIPYPSRLHDQKLRNKSYRIISGKSLPGSFLRSRLHNLFPPLDNPELTIRRRSHNDPTLLNNSEMAAEGNGDLPILDLPTMEELCQPSLNGRGGLIASIAIQATKFGPKNDMIQQVQNSCQFHGLPGDDANRHLDKFLHVTQSIKVNGVTDDALRLYLFPYSLTHHATAWFDRLPRNSINTFEQMAKMFLGKYFSPSMVTKLRNEITNFCQRPDESLFKAWERGIFMKRVPEECYDLIENMTAHHNDWDTSAQRSESSSSITSSSDTKIAALKAKMAEINKNLMRVLHVNQHVKAVTPNCKTCGGPHSFNDCPATVGNTQNVYVAGAYQVVERETEETKDTVHPTNNESTKDVQPPVVSTESLILNSEPVIAPIIESVASPVSAPRPNQRPSIPYPSRLHDQKLRNKANDQREKFFQIFKDLISTLALTPPNEHCSAVLLKKFPEKLGDPGKFIIPCDYPKMAECLALADLGVSINLMPLFVWNKHYLPDLSPSCMTLELADRWISRPVGVAEDVFVKVGTFHFPTDLVVVDFDADPRVPLIIGRSFLKTGRALIDVFEGELTFRVGKEAITFNLDQTSRYSANYNDMTANRIDVIDMACEEYSQEVLGFSDVIASGNPTPYYDPIISTTSPTLTSFGNSDFLLKEVDAFLALEDDPTLSEVDQSYVDTEGRTSNQRFNIREESILKYTISSRMSDFLLFEEADAFLGLEDDPNSLKINPFYNDPEGDILLLKAILNSEPLPPIPNHEQYMPSLKKELKVCEAKTVKSSIDEPLEVELKDLPPHLKYIFLEGNNKFPIIIAKELGDEKKSALIKVLKSHKRAIAWKLSDIRGINLEFYTYKILMEEDYKPATKCCNGVKTLISVLTGRRAMVKEGIVLGNKISKNGIEVDKAKVNVIAKLPHPTTVKEKMLKRCEDTNLCLNWEKSHFMVKEGIVLSHKISKNGIEVDKAQVDVIDKLPHPTTVKGIQSFLGHAGFYRRFIQDFSKIARPMTRLLEKAPILIALEWDMPFELMCDASDFAIGAVLGQRQDKHFRSIHYASKTMTEAESNYTTTEKEMLAVVYAFEKFRSYLIMNKSIVYTDHSTLKYLFAKKDSKMRLLLQEFTFKVIDTKGAENLAADHLSRLENPHQNVLDLKEINESLPLETLNMVSFRDLEPPEPLSVIEERTSVMTSLQRKVQLNELNELRDQAYENSLIYKEKTQRLHDSKIKDHVFNIGDRVLLFNSRLKIFSVKLKSRWSGRFTISYVFPYGTVELSQPDGLNFKVNGHRLKHYFREDVPKMVVPDLQTFPKDQ